jgi:mRNA-degrading endonuclease YafQ of YafQ-DinJ toxin-antitoxin module
MSHITKVVFTDLFWETLSEHRKHSRYRDFRNSIAMCIRYKSQNRSFTSASDKPFNADPTLKGIWHCKLSRNPDVIMFYRMSENTMYLSMIGDHHDYGYNNKGTNAGQVMANRIEQAIARGHVATPDWETIKWSTPMELLENPELAELSLAALSRVHTAVQMEAESFELLLRVEGKERSQLPEVYSPWFEALDALNDKIELIVSDRRLQKKADRGYGVVETAFTR